MADPRIAIVCSIMVRCRTERLKRMIKVRDMRRKDGRLTIEEEAAAILAALDDHDIKKWDDAIADAKADLAAEGRS